MNYNIRDVSQLFYPSEIGLSTISHRYTKSSNIAWFFVFYYYISATEAGHVSMLSQSRLNL